MSLPFGCIMYIRMYFVIMKLQIFKSAYEMVRDILGGSGGEAPREKIRVFRWLKWIFIKKNGVWQPMSEKIPPLITPVVIISMLLRAIQPYVQYWRDQVARQNLSFSAICISKTKRGFQNIISSLHFCMQPCGQRGVGTSTDRWFCCFSIIGVSFFENR